MNLKSFLLIFLSAICLERMISQESFEFEYDEIKVTIFPKAPGICPNNSADVSCIEEFDTYKWEMVNPVPGFTPLYGKNQTFVYPGEYKLTVEKPINNTLCSKETLFTVHDLNEADGIEEYLLGNGFHAFPIFVEQVGLKSSDGNPSCDMSRIKFNEAFKFIDLNAEDILVDILNYFKPFAEEGWESIELKSTNECLCDIGVNELEDEFHGTNLSIWAHEFTTTEEDSYGKLYLKGWVPFEGASPKNESQAEHLTSIYNSVINDAQNNADPVNATFEHLRVMVSNLFMLNPTGGYNLSTQCEVNISDIEDVHVFTPGGSAVLLPIDASQIFIENDLNSIAFGSLLKFESMGKNWQNYHRNEDYIISNGYFNPINAEFFEGFTTSITECEDCDMEVASIGFDCDNFSCTLEHDLYTTENFNLEEVQNGGFNNEIDGCNSLWKLWPVTKKASKTLIYDLLCALKNGDQNFEYNSKFSDKVVFAKNITLGDQLFDYVGLTLPKNGSSIELLDSPILNNYGTTPGFTNSYEISSSKEVRLNFFYFDKNQSEESGQKCRERLKPVYSFEKWKGKILKVKNCLQYYSLADKYTLLDFINPPNKNNLLLMVNGYRIFKGKPGKKWYKGGVEYPHKEPDETINPCFEFNEGGEYWGSKAHQFAKRINSNVVFADGHHSITTSNHIQMATNNLLETSFVWSFNSCPTLKVFCNNSICFLNDIPNGLGFNYRYTRGYAAGIELWNKMVDGEVHILLSEDKTKIEGKIDIVAHSFGYAYSKGILDFLNTKLATGNTFGNYYIVAPENAKAYPDEEFDAFDPLVQSSFMVDLNLFEHVFQYGSDFTPNGDPTCKQDGIAAQARVRGLDANNLNNVFIPASENQNKNFIKAHQIENFDWMFAIPENAKGYVRPRD